MNERQEKVLQIIAEVLERDVASIKPEQHLKDDLQLDSAQSLELLSEIEDAFEIEISEVEAAKIETVQDILGFAPQG